MEFTNAKTNNIRHQGNGVFSLRSNRYRISGTQSIVCHTVLNSSQTVEKLETLNSTAARIDERVESPTDCANRYVNMSPNRICKMTRMVQATGWGRIRYRSPGGYQTC